MFINIEIDELLFPKLLEIENEKLDSTIKFLLNIGYQNVYSSVNERNLINNMNNLCRKFKDDIISGVDSKNLNLQNWKMKYKQIKQHKMHLIDQDRSFHCHLSLYSVLRGQDW